MVEQVSPVSSGLCLTTAMTRHWQNRVVSTQHSLDTLDTQGQNVCLIRHTRAVRQGACLNAGVSPRAHAHTRGLR